MKIGVPAILNTLFIVFLIGVSFYFWINYFEHSHISEFPNKKTIFYLVLYLLGPIIILVAAKRFKWLL